MYFALYMYSMPVHLRFRRLRAQKVAVLVPTLRSISHETDFVKISAPFTLHQPLVFCTTVSVLVPPSKAETCGAKSKEN